MPTLREYRIRHETNNNNVVRFREGTSNGGWLRHTELVASQQAGVVLTAAVHSHSHLHAPLLYTPGFTPLAWYASN